MVSLIAIQLKKYKLYERAGFTLLETLISMTVFSIFLLFFLASFSHIFASQDTSWKRVEASMQAQEGLEISYNIFTNTHDWTGLVNELRAEPVFHISNEGSLRFIPDVEVTDDFKKQIMLEDVYRSSVTGEIQETVSDTSTVYDPDTILIKSRVEWMGKGGREHIEYVTYITRGEEQ